MAEAIILSVSGCLAFVAVYTIGVAINSATGWVDKLVAFINDDVGFDDRHIYNEEEEK